MAEERTFSLLYNQKVIINGGQGNGVGHFRVPKTLTFNMRLGAQPFL